MIDHVALNVLNFEKSRTFFLHVFEPLRYTIAFEEGGFCAFNVQGGLFEIWQFAGEGRVAPIHVAFRVGDKTLVDAFYEAALANGGKDNGAPGPRDYTPNYYAAFILDPDGNNIEVMFDE
ncbi:MAG: VOC family protein [Patescibacteria group bacterium]